MGSRQLFRDQEIDWERTLLDLDRRGFAVLSEVLSAESCEDLVSLYTGDQRFRSRIDMARHSFGRGEYKYFKYPLPPLVQQIRSALYPRLAPLASEWLRRLGGEKSPFPETLSEFIELCHSSGQERATPLLLKYGPGDFNCLHQDLYGEIVFPFQAAFFLSQRGSDYEGGEFVMTEQRPRRQSRVEALAPNRGDGVIFAVQHRPVRGARGHYRATLRHGVSTVRSGSRYTLGVIFHDAS